MIEQDFLAKICPLCGEPNACKQAEELKINNSACSQESCWCFAQKLTNQSREHIKQTTDNQRCICLPCLQEITKATI